MSRAGGALLLDYAGVLTTPVGPVFRAFEERIGVPPGLTFSLLVEASTEADGGLIGAVERGEVSSVSFDTRLRGLYEDAGHRIPPGDLLARMFADLQPAGGLWDVALRAREAGLATALVSNSWGLEMYRRDLLDTHLDVQVISGEVGLRKPEHAIFELAADKVGVEPSRCAFVDDFVHNVEAAVEVGMFGVHHTGDDAATTAALSGFFGIDLSG